MLEAKWETILPDTDYEIVTPLINQEGVYAGSNGHVLRLDPGSSNVTAKNTLGGFGHHEVRLAAPVDASLLAVGINGYVLGLDPHSLSIRWSTSLPGSGNEVVSVLCAPGGVYVGSNGYVYRLGLDDGAVKATNDLPGYGRHETRVGITVSNSCLLVGINGYAFGLDPYSLETRWIYGMPGSGNNITTVVGGVGVGYWACQGRVYRLSESNGEVLSENDLSGTGNSEVRMVLDNTTSHLYAGTNGYGICLLSDNLTTVYSISLPGSGYSITDVANGDKVAYFANNGHVFQLDSFGNVTAKNDLPGRGETETRLATNSRGATKLIIGINGYCLGLDISYNSRPVDFSGATYPVKWMPYVLDIVEWQQYNPSEIDGVGMLLGYYRGKIIGDDLKAKKCTVLQPNSDGNSYTWVYTTDGALIYKWRDHDDRANYTRRGQLGSGNPVICAGEFRLDANYAVQSVIAMVNNASGHYEPDGGACLQYVAKKLDQLGIGTRNTKWYWI